MIRHLQPGESIQKFVRALSDSVGASPDQNCADEFISLCEAVEVLAIQVEGIEHRNKVAAFHKKQAKWKKGKP